MKVTQQFFSVARGGTYTVNDTNETTKDFYGFYVCEDTVVSSLKISGTDQKATYISTPATALKAGQIITCAGDDNFSGITLTSGSVVLILKP